MASFHPLICTKANSDVRGIARDKVISRRSKGLSEHVCAFRRRRRRRSSSSPMEHRRAAMCPNCGATSPSINSGVGVAGCLASRFGFRGKKQQQKKTGGCTPSSQPPPPVSAPEAPADLVHFSCSHIEAGGAAVSHSAVKGKRGGGQPPPPPHLRLGGSTCRVTAPPHVPAGSAGGNTLTVHPTATLVRNDSFDYTFQTTVKSCRAATRRGLAGSRMGLMNHAT